jgi:hypothetical protein
MIDDIIVIDDVIPKSYQDEIENMMFDQGNFPWYYVHDVTFVQEKIEKAKIQKSNPALCHVFYSYEMDHTSPFLNFVKPLAYLACAKINKEVKEIITARSFLQLPSGVEIIEPNHPHVDLDFSHLVCLYYVNDNEAPTNIYKQTSKEIGLRDIPNTNFEIDQKVYPKKGRCVFFNGNRYHSSSSPNMTSRCIINFDIGI